MSHPGGEYSLATTLYTWSPNKLAHLLSVIMVSYFEELNKEDYLENL
jgi:hypothetical protein